MKDLKSILKSFYLLSGMNMTIFDIHQNVVVSYPNKKCPLCYLLDQYKDARNKCTKCDMEAMEHVFQSSQIYVYKCWCGLYEAIMPLYTYGQLTGYLMLGQAIDADEDTSNVEILASQYIHETKELKKAVHQTCKHTKAQIKALGELVDICAEYLSLTNTVNVPSSDLAEAIQSYLVKHYMEQISIDSLCSYFNVSKATLHTYFKKKYGTTIHQRLLSIRLNEARKLLESTNASMKDISHTVGFLDADYFSKAFKKKYRISPTDVKKECRK